MVGQQQCRPGEIISSVYRHANDRGHGLFNPAADIKPSSIAIFKPRERTLTPEEIGLFFRTLDAIGAMGTMKMALKLVLITMVRKGEFTNATWDEIDFKKMDMDNSFRPHEGKPGARYLPA